jgi:hypothetical protein
MALAGDPFECLPGAGIRVDRRRTPKLPAVGSKSVARVCIRCGVELGRTRRKVCDSCLSAYDGERTAKLSSGGRETLAAMRASENDPARSPEARAKLAAASRERMRAIRGWEREHGKTFDAERYETEILPAIQALTVPALMAKTGLSQHYCWQVRSGRKRLHSMHWETVRGTADSTTVLTD